jgi:hypothetical protein
MQCIECSSSGRNQLQYRFCRWLVVRHAGLPCVGRAPYLDLKSGLRRIGPSPSKTAGGGDLGPLEGHPLGGGSKLEPRIGILRAFIALLVRRAVRGASGWRCTPVRGRAMCRSTCSAPSIVGEGVKKCKDDISGNSKIVELDASYGKI